jgi:hypothetical protein
MTDAPRFVAEVLLRGSAPTATIASLAPVEPIAAALAPPDDAAALRVVPA